jgi:hypothetical protein
MPYGMLKDAKVPFPSAQPELPDPASVVTTLLEMTMYRMRLLPESAIIANDPLGSMDTPRG